MDPLKKKRIEAGLDDPQDIIDDLGNEDDNDDLEDDELDELFDDDDKSDDEDDDEDEDDDDESGRGRSGNSVPPSQFNRVRAREAAERRRRQEVEAENQRLNAKLKEQEDAENAKPPISDDDIRAAAAGMVVYPSTATEDQKKQILAGTEAQLRKVIDLVMKGVKPPKELAALTERLAEYEDKQIFNEEWDNFSDSLPTVYPNATPRQLRIARKAMDRLAHAPKYADKEFDYVFYKNKDIFDQIFRKSRKHAFENRDNVRGRDEDVEDNDSQTPAKNLTPKELLKRKRQIDAESSKQEGKDGWNILNPDGTTVG